MSQKRTSERAPAAVEHMVLQLRRAASEATTTTSYTAGRWEVRISTEGERSVCLTLAFLRRSGGQWQARTADITLVVDGQPVDVGGDLAYALRIVNGEHPAEDATRRTRPHAGARGGLDSVGVRRHSVIRN